MQAPPDASPAPAAEPQPPRDQVVRARAVQDPRFLGQQGVPPQIEMVEMPDMRERRERFAASAGRQFERSALARVKVDERVRAEAANLSDPAFEVRERASRALLDAAIDDLQIWALLDRDQLDDEAHDRMLAVAVRRVLEKPRGALGIRMGNAPTATPGVIVQATIPGMPADRVLRTGDVIETLDGRSLADSADLAESLQGHAPGTEVSLTVLRTERDAKGNELRGADGKPVRRRMNFKVPLGNANDLDRADPGMPGMATNMVNQQRRAMAEVLRVRFERPLPVPVVVTPESAEPAAP